MHVLSFKRIGTIVAVIEVVSTGLLRWNDNLFSITRLKVKCDCYVLWSKAIWYFIFFDNYLPYMFNKSYSERLISHNKVSQSLLLPTLHRPSPGLPWTASDRSWTPDPGAVVPWLAQSSPCVHGVSFSARQESLWISSSRLVLLALFLSAHWSEPGKQVWF